MMDLIKWSISGMTPVILPAVLAAICILLINGPIRSKSTALGNCLIFKISGRAWIHDIALHDQQNADFRF